jgi:hypothetical protein
MSANAGPLSVCAHGYYGGCFVCMLPLVERNAPLDTDCVETLKLIVAHVCPCPDYNCACADTYKGWSLDALDALDALKAQLP